MPKTGTEERGGKRRRIGEVEEFAKKTKIRTEARAEDIKNPGGGVNVNQFHVARETGAASVGESCVKSDETVFDFTKSAWREREEHPYYDAISRAVRGRRIKVRWESSRSIPIRATRRSRSTVAG